MQLENLKNLYESNMHRVGSGCLAWAEACATMTAYSDELKSLLENQTMLNSTEYDTCRMIIESTIELQEEEVNKGKKKMEQKEALEKIYKNSYENSSRLSFDNFCKKFENASLNSLIEDDDCMDDSQFQRAKSLLAKMVSEQNKKFKSSVDAEKKKKEKEEREANAKKLLEAKERNQKKETKVANECKSKPKITHSTKPIEKPKTVTKNKVKLPPRDPSPIKKDNYLEIETYGKVDRIQPQGPRGSSVRTGRMTTVGPSIVSCKRVTEKAVRVVPKGPNCIQSR